MKINTLLKIRTHLEETDQQVIDQIGERIDKAFLNQETAKEFINSILKLLYTGFNINSKEYLDKVFFDFHIIRQNTLPHKARIYCELDRLAQLNEVEVQIHLVNIYRNIVSDLFDPYINLIVATLQFIEGSFKSIQQTNLGLGERNKYEFALSRLKPTKLFNGYNSIVRNAISHTGTEGVIYESNAVVFRSIKRGEDYKVEFEKWTNEGIREKITELLDFIHAVDNCIEIFGFDVSEIILKDKELSHKFLDEILSKEQRLELHNRSNVLVEQLIESDLLAGGDRLDLLTKIYVLQCENGNKPVKSIHFTNDKKDIGIKVPSMAIHMEIEKDVICRSLELLRYCTIAIGLFKDSFRTYLIQEIKEKDKGFLAIKVNGQDLEDYVKEEAGLYDLLDCCELFINGKKINVEVDFQKLEEMEYLNLERRFPRRKK